MDSGSLLLGFLDFYGNHFDPRLTGISVGRSRYFSRSAPLPPVPAPPQVAPVPGAPSAARLFYGQVRLFALFACHMCDMCCVFVFSLGQTFRWVGDETEQAGFTIVRAFVWVLRGVVRLSECGAAVVL